MRIETDGRERLFFAVEIGPAAAASVAAAVEEITKVGFPGRLSPPENWHITLRFLGDTTAEQRAELLQEVESLELPGRSEILLGGWGTFPRPSAARVLWLGVEDRGETLQQLATLLESAARAVGFAPEHRPFRPHLTLARFRHPADLRPMLPNLPTVRERSPVDRLLLLRSELGSGPPRYSAAATFPLPPKG